MIFQIGSALLDACVLSVLEREDMYGYILTQNVKEVVDISESTLYPVLRRLQKEAYLVTYDQPFAGRNITDKGREQLAMYRKEWIAYKSNIDRILTGEEKQ